MGWVSTRLFMDPPLLNIAVISCLETSASRGQAARSTLLYCQEQGTYWVPMVSSRLYLALGPNCYWTCSAVHYMKRDGLGLTSELRSCVNGVRLTFSIALFPVPNKPYGFCQRKTLWTKARKALWTEGLKHCGLKHCGLKD